MRLICRTIGNVRQTEHRVMAKRLRDVRGRVILREKCAMGNRTATRWRECILVDGEPLMRASLNYMDWLSAVWRRGNRRQASGPNASASSKTTRGL